MRPPRLPQTLRPALGVVAVLPLSACSVLPYEPQTPGLVEPPFVATPTAHDPDLPAPSAGRAGGSWNVVFLPAVRR